MRGLPVKIGQRGCTGDPAFGTEDGAVETGHEPSSYGAPKDLGGERDLESSHAAAAYPRHRKQQPVCYGPSQADLPGGFPLTGC